MLHFKEIVAPYVGYLETLAAVPPVGAAIDAVRRGALQEAADRLAPLAVAGGRDPHVYAALGFIAYESRQGELAVKLLESALELEPAPEVRALLGACYLGLDRPEEAIVSLREALRERPEQHAAHWLLWSALDATGRLDDALAALRRTLAAQDVPVIAAARMPIEETTLCVVDCSTHTLAERALRICMTACAFSEVKFLSDRSCAIPGVTSQLIAPLRSARDYSRFVVKELLRYIETEYVLLVQWDGYVVNPAAWSPEFLLYDYIGARWSHAHGRGAAHHNVGNGGFSLRSRTLLRALQDPAIEITHPEDQAICRIYRDYLERRYAIAFAPDDVADRFAFEHIEPTTLPFGFHGVINLARFLGAPTWTHMDYYFGP